MEIILIYAEGANGAFGWKNRLPWNVPEDLAHFQKLTKHHAVLMGRNTWESLPANVRPLPHRMNLVLTSRGILQSYPAVHSIEAGVQAARRAGHTKLFIIGGPLILQKAQKQAHRICRTVVPYTGTFDVHGPIIDLHEWKLVNVRKIDSSGDAPHIDIEEYVPLDSKRQYRPNMFQRVRNWIYGKD